MDKADLVIFYGPPYTGKSIFYERNLSSFVRIEPALEFHKNPSLTLRQLIMSKVIALLKKGKRIVIDDENASYVMRDSYMCLVKKRFPDCKILCLTFRPKYGKQQLLWNREYALARATMERLNNGNIHYAVPKSCLKTSDCAIQKWMEETEKQEYPRNTEGYWKLEEITTTVLIKSRYKFEVPGLIIQWEGLFDGSSEVLLPKVSETLSRWYEQNTCGRILIVKDSNGVAADSSDRDIMIQKVLKALADKLNACPIYMITVHNQIESGKFSLPPSPGILIFLQRLHCLNLSHKSTVYVYKSSEHMKMAENAGIKHIKVVKFLKGNLETITAGTVFDRSRQFIPCVRTMARSEDQTLDEKLLFVFYMIQNMIYHGINTNASRLFNHPHMVGSMHSYTSVPLPSLMQEQEVVMDTNDETSEPSIPLFLSMRGDQTFCSAELGSGRCLYLVVKNPEILQKYQDMYRSHASLSTDMMSKIDDLNQQSTLETTRSRSDLREHKSQRDLPSWMMKGRKRESLEPTPEKLQYKKKLKRKKGKDQVDKNPLIYVMTRDELKDIALEIIEKTGESPC